MSLTEEQKKAVKRGEVLRIVEDQVECVLIRADIYERLKHLLCDDSPWTEKEQLTLLAESGKNAGWDDPQMDVYDHYDDKTR